MQSNNPVFRRSEEFNRGGASTAYASNYANPSTWSTGLPGQPGATGQPGGYPAPPAPTRPRAPASTGPMTIDTVVQKTTLSLGIVIAAALVTWLVTPDVSSDAGLSTLYAAITIGALGGLVFGLVNSFKRVISPALVIAYCVFEGVALGALSKEFDAVFGGGIVVQAVVGTFAAFGGTLAAYKVFNVKVTPKFQKMVVAAGFGMLALSLFEVVLGLFGSQLGLFGFGAVGLLFSVAGLVLGVFYLMLDFNFVEQGVANGIPERESWRAAFGLTLSLVYIYINLLRILAILSDN